MRRFIGRWLGPSREAQLLQRRLEVALECFEAERRQWNKLAEGYETAIRALLREVPKDRRAAFRGMTFIKRATGASAR